MAFGPKTLNEARKHNYGHFHKVPYQEGFCIAKVWESGRGAQSRQCCRKRGFGPEGAFCRQHDPSAEEERQKKAEQAWERKRQASPYARLEKAVEKIAKLRKALEIAYPHISDTIGGREAAAKVAAILAETKDPQPRPANEGEEG